MKTVFFDLDGTLTDSRPGILAGMASALTALGLPTRPEAVPEDVIGPPLYDSFCGIYGFDDARAREGVRLYREYYSAQGLLENEVYPGVVPMLRRLSAAGLRLALATGKPHPYARRILSHFGLDAYIAPIFGAEFDGTRGDKAELLAYALGELSLDVRSAVMVGDRRYDIEGALATGIAPLGVLWGYGSREELLRAGATDLTATPEEAADRICALLL